MQEPVSANLYEADQLTVQKNTVIKNMANCKGRKTLFSNDDVSVAFHVTQLVTVEIDHQLPQPRMGGSEIDLHLGVFPGSHRGAKPVE